MNKYIAILLLVFSGSVSAISGNECRALSESKRLMWLVGAIDGALTAQLILTNEQPPLVVCLGDLEMRQRELKRKEKALAELAALLVLRKKYDALWEGTEDD